MSRKKTDPIEIIHVASHPSRWAMLKALKQPLSSQELAEETGLSQHNIAWHGRELRKHGLVRVKRDKKFRTRLIYSRVPFSAGVAVGEDAVAGAAFSLDGSAEPKMPTRLKALDRARKWVG